MAKKAYHHVTRDLRCQIAREIGVSQSTISREIARNSNGYKYSAREADSASANRRSKAARVPKKLKGNLKLKIRRCIEEDWSPEQISGRLKLEQEQVVVSHETIYRYIRSDKANGGLLYQHLRHGNKKYRKRSVAHTGSFNSPQEVIKYFLSIIEAREWQS